MIDWRFDIMLDVNLPIYLLVQVLDDLVRRDDLQLALCPFVLWSKFAAMNCGHQLAHLVVVQFYLCLLGSKWSPTRRGWRTNNRTSASTTRRAGWVGSCTTMRSCWRISCHRDLGYQGGGGGFWCLYLMFFLFPFCSCLSRCSWWLSFHLDIIRGVVIKSETNKVWHRNLEVESGGGHGGSTLW